MALFEMVPEVDTLTHLEERIQRAVQLVARLRQEKESALRELAEVQALNLAAVARLEAELEAERSKSETERAATGAEAESLRAELESLRNERGQVRERLEKLLSSIDLLGD